MKATNDRSPSANESMGEDFDSDLDDTEEEGPCDNEQDEGNSYMNDGMETVSRDEEETDPQSMDEELGDVSYDLKYQQNEAIEKLSTIFCLFNIDPIHDK